MSHRAPVPLDFRSCREREPRDRNAASLAFAVMTERPLLMAVPNVSEGRDLAALEAIERLAGAGALPRPAHRSRPRPRGVHARRRAGRAGAGAARRRARRGRARSTSRAHAGIHPHVGALDVMPVVYLDDERRGAACAEALTAAALVGEELGLPVFLYGELATRPEHAERAWIRARRAAASWRGACEAGELVPDYGPRRAHPTAGRGARHGAPAARGLQRRPGHRRRRAGAGDRRRAARVGRRPPGRARDRPLPGGPRAARRCRPTSTTTGRCRCARSWSACASARDGGRGGADRAGAAGGVRGLSRGRAAARLRSRSGT